MYAYVPPTPASSPLLFHILLVNNHLLFSHKTVKKNPLWSIWDSFFKGVFVVHSTKTLKFELMLLDKIRLDLIHFYKMFLTYLV